MTGEAISPLRRRMIEDMTIRHLSPKTQHGYVQRVKKFTAFLDRSPTLRASRMSAATSCTWPRAALACRLSTTPSRCEIENHTRFVREPRKLPVVLSPEEVARLLDAAPGLKAASSVAYGAGLRVY
jgi:integrase